MGRRAGLQSPDNPPLLVALHLFPGGRVDRLDLDNPVGHSSRQVGIGFGHEGVMAYVYGPAASENVTRSQPLAEPPIVALLPVVPVPGSKSTRPTTLQGGQSSATAALTRYWKCFSRKHVPPDRPPPRPSPSESHEGREDPASQLALPRRLQGLDVHRAHRTDCRATHQSDWPTHRAHWPAHRDSRPVGSPPVLTSLGDGRERTKASWVRTTRLRLAHLDRRSGDGAGVRHGRRGHLPHDLP